jgi:hypothetical protein
MAMTRNSEIQEKRLVRRQRVIERSGMTVDGIEVTTPVRTAYDPGRQAPD